MFLNINRTLGEGIARLMSNQILYGRFEQQQSLLMQGIAVDYASRSASVGATFMGGGDARTLISLSNALGLSTNCKST